MTTCERCGRELPDTLNFCPSCGTRLSAGGASTYQTKQSTVNTFHNAAIGSSSIPIRATKNNTALIIEILLNLILSLYGVGWLMAGAVRVGVILLIASFFVYWPVLIFGVLFTFGLGIFSFGALALGLVILNGILLNNYLNRKAARRMGSF